MCDEQGGCEEEEGEEEGGALTADAFAAEDQGGCECERVSVCGFFSGQKCGWDLVCRLTCRRLNCQISRMREETASE